MGSYVKHFLYLDKVLKYLPLFSINREGILTIKPKSIKLSAILLVIKAVLATFYQILYV